MFNDIFVIFKTQDKNKLYEIFALKHSMQYVCLCKIQYEVCSLGIKQNWKGTLPVTSYIG